MTPTEFLLARIAEDETDARAATEGPWQFEPAGDYECGEPACCSDYWDNRIWGGGVVIAESHLTSDADSKHIARHDPARVLAECKAKRQVIGAHLYTEDGRHSCAHPSGARGQWNYEEWEPCVTLASLALPYAGHPGYREEWKP